MLPFYPLALGNLCCFSYYPISCLSRRTVIVIFVCPLNSIIEDQLNVLQDRGITTDVLQLTSDNREATHSLFHSKDIDESSAERCLKTPSAMLMNGDIQIVFAHSEALLSKEGCDLMNSRVCQRNVVACVVD